MSALITKDEMSAQAMVSDPAIMQQMYRMAEMMATARVTVPKHLVGQPGDCLAIIFQAAQWHMNPYAVAQKTHIVNGTLGYEAQLVNAVVSSSSLLQNRIAYQWEGDWKGCNGKTDKDDSRACTVTARLKGEDAPRSLRVSMAQVGDTRNSPLWVADPRQQLAYLATKRWARLHAPDVLLGVYTTDELAEIVVSEPAPKSDLRARLLDAQEPVEPTAEVPGIAEVLRAISEAESEQGLAQAGALAAALTDNSDKAEARMAFKERREALKAAEKQEASTEPVQDDWIDAATAGV